MNSYFCSVFVLVLICLIGTIKCELLYAVEDEKLEERILETKVNPNCQGKCEDITLVYTTSKNSTTRDHYFWSSFRDESPSFFAASSNDVSSEANIDWSKLLSKDPTGSISLSNTTNAIGISVKKIFFWNEAENATLNETMSRDWQNTLNTLNYTGEYSNKSSHASFMFEDPDSNFTVNIIVHTQSTHGRNYDFPQLTFSDRSFHFEIVLNGTSKVEYSKNRMGVEFLLVHYNNTSFEPESTTTIDDEFSPGVFSEWHVQFKNPQSNQSSHMKWKPVGYSKPDRIIAHTIDSIVKNVSEISVEGLDHVTRGFFDDKKFLVTNFNVTFETGEEYYSKSNYTSFSLVLSLDAYYDDSGLSGLVKVAIVIGFGIPVIAIIASAIYLLVKKWRRSRYENLIR